MRERRDNAFSQEGRAFASLALAFQLALGAYGGRNAAIYFAEEDRRLPDTFRESLSRSSPSPRSARFVWGNGPKAYAMAPSNAQSVARHPPSSTFSR